MKQAIFLIGMLMLLPLAYAQTQEVNVGITPDSPFFALDKFFEAVQLAITTNDVSKISLKAKFLNERIIELQFVAEKKPKFTGKALAELKQSTDDLAEEAETKPKQIKELVEKNLKNSKVTLEEIKARFESDDNQNNDNAIAGLKIAIENQDKKIDEIEEDKDKNKIDVKIKGNIAEVRAVINDQEIRYKVATADVSEVLNDISARAGVSIETIKNADVKLNEQEVKVEVEDNIKITRVTKQQWKS